MGAARPAPAGNPGKGSVMRAILAIAVLVAATVFAFPAAGQNLPCAPRAKIAEALKSVNETQRAIGTMKTNAGATLVLELWVAPGGGYTVLLSRSDGISCLLAAGKNMVLKPAATPSSI